MQKQRGRSNRRRVAAAALFLGVGVLGACENIMEVELPGNMTEEDFLQPETAVTMINSAIADFECSYSMFTVTTAAMEDTWWRATGYWGDWAEYRADRVGTGECATGDTNASWATGLQKSRYVAETAHEKISEWGSEQVPNAERLLAQAAVYAGLNYQIFGETFCELTVDVGPIMQPEEVLRTSEEWFTTALGHIGDGDFAIVSSPSIKQLALLGRARVRLALGDREGAAADAALVEPGFIAHATRESSVRQRWNAIYRGLNVQGYSAVAGPVMWQGGPVPFTGYRDLGVLPNGVTVSGEGFPVTTASAGAVADPRVPVRFMNEFLQDGVTDNYAQQKYTSTDDDIPIARWAEAQLILAEAAAATNPAGAVDYVNALRDANGLPRYAGPTDAASIRNLIIEERRREFFFEGRFLAEKLRHRDVLWFPMGQGANHKGVTYGDAHCFMMPVSEYQNNPNVTPGYQGPY